MGTEFLLKKGNVLRSRWTREARKLATPDLFSEMPACTSRSVIADIAAGSHIAPREKVIVQCEGSALVFLRDMVPVATKRDPPPDLVAAIRDRGGCAIAETRAIYEVSGSVELQIKE